MSGSVDLRAIPPLQAQAGQSMRPESRTQAKESFADLADKERSGKEPVSPGTLVLHARTQNGQEWTLYGGKDILASVGGNGGSVNVKYHESSTASNPVVRIWGKSRDGNDYEAVVSLNEIDLRHASPAEMIALNAHLSRTGDTRAAKAGPIALWISIGKVSPDTGMDFEQYYKEYIAAQAAGGNEAGAALYRLQLEALLFAHRQNEEGYGISTVTA